MENEKKSQDPDICGKIYFNVSQTGMEPDGKKILMLFWKWILLLVRKWKLDEKKKWVTCVFIFFCFVWTLKILKMELDADIRKILFQLVHFDLEHLTDLVALCQKIGFIGFIG